MKKMIDKMLLMALPVICLMGSCTREPEEVISAKGETVTLQITADGFETEEQTTRTKGDGYITTFANGDQIGITVLDDKNNILNDNVPYQYDGVRWSPVDASKTVRCYNYLTCSYLIYLPYSAAMNGLKTEAEIISAFTPQTDQSTWEQYSGSDLMTGEGIIGGTVGSRTLAVNLKHQMALVLIHPQGEKKALSDGYKFGIPCEEINDLKIGTNITTGKAYESNDGIVRGIVKPGNSVAMSIEYTIEGKQWKYSTTINPQAGKYYRYNIVTGTNTSIHTLAAGDYFMADGSILPASAMLTERQKKLCIGIVFQANPGRMSQFEKDKGWTHGYVMALTNAPNGGFWGPDIDLHSDLVTINKDIIFDINCETVGAMPQDLEGYRENRFIIDNFGEGGANTLSSKYPAFYAASRYGKTTETQRYAAPVFISNSGWYLPSSGQWWNILTNLGGVNLNSYETSTNDEDYISGLSKPALENLNKYMAQIPGSTTFKYYNNDNEVYQTSTERSVGWARYIRFSKENLGLYWSAKARNYKPRCILAF